VKLLLRLLVLAVAAAAVCFYLLTRPYAGFSGEKFVDIPKGTGTAQIGRLLREAGVIRSEWQFLAARALERRKLQAGEYRFDRPASVLEVYERIARGDIFYYELVVPEGRNLFEIGAAAEELGLFPAARFVHAARRPELIRDLDPQAPSLEGYLFPNTYRVGRHVTPEKLCQMMTGKFREVWKGLQPHADVHRTVTLASLVEKESKLPDERRKIAAVFERRLSIGMKLDCDPTTIYAAILGGTWRGTIYRSDLESDHPYNTYRHAGLPPGPIANPGKAPLEAVLHPAGGDAIYFVLRPDGSGGHTFSGNMADHQAAIQKYRQGLHRQ
jgi:UPF0755 protein